MSAATASPYSSTGHHTSTRSLSPANTNVRLRRLHTPSTTASGLAPLYRSGSSQALPAIAAQGTSRGCAASPRRRQPTIAQSSRSRLPDRASSISSDSTGAEFPFAGRLQAMVPMREIGRLLSPSRGWPCGMRLARRLAARHTVSAQAPGVLPGGRLPAANMRKVLVRPSAISTIEMMRSLFSPPGVSCLGGG